MELTPITLRQAQAFVNEHHRHNIAPRGHKFSIGLEKDGILIGVCIVAQPSEPAKPWAIQRSSPTRCQRKAAQAFELLAS